MNEPEVLNELSVLFRQLLAEATAVFIVRVDSKGRISYANAAFARACGIPPGGEPFASFVTARSHEILSAHLATDNVAPLNLHVIAPDGSQRTLRAFARALSDGFALVGEPDWDGHVALERLLHASNAELDVLMREHVRQKQQLEGALRTLRETHWQLEKIGDVLPMCVSCRAVKTAESTWENVADYLAKASDFVSHGYCAGCAATTMRETDGSPD